MMIVLCWLCWYLVFVLFVDLCVLVGLFDVLCVCFDGGCFCVMFVVLLIVDV